MVMVGWREERAGMVGLAAGGEEQVARAVVKGAAAMAVAVMAVVLVGVKTAAERVVAVKAVARRAADAAGRSRSPPQLQECSHQHRGCLRGLL